MPQVKIYQTIFTVTVLSTEPLPDGITMTEIQSKVDRGYYLCKVFKQTEQEKVGLDAVAVVENFGSEISFFNMDEVGNSLDYEDEGPKVLPIGVLSPDRKTVVNQCISIQKLAVEQFGWPKKTMVIKGHSDDIVAGAEKVCEYLKNFLPEGHETTWENFKFIVAPVKEV